MNIQKEGLISLFQSILLQQRTIQYWSSVWKTQPTQDLINIFLRQILTIKSHDGGKEGDFVNHKVNSYHLQSTRSAQPPGQLSL